MKRIEAELKEIKNKIQEIENEYLFVQDYNLITTLLHKLNVDKIEINNNEISNNYQYILIREENKVIISKQEE